MKVIWSLVPVRQLPSRTALSSAPSPWSVRDARNDFILRVRHSPKDRSMDLGLIGRGCIPNEPCMPVDKQQFQLPLVVTKCRPRSRPLSDPERRERTLPSV